MDEKGDEDEISIAKKEKEKVKEEAIEEAADQVMTAGAVLVDAIHHISKKNKKNYEY